MKITALEIVKSWCSDSIYVKDSCTGISLFRVFGSEMSTLVSKNEVKDFYDYVTEHKTIYKKLSIEEKEKLSFDFDNYIKQIGNCGTCFLCKKGITA